MVGESFLETNGSLTTPLGDANQEQMEVHTKGWYHAHKQ